MPKKAYAIDTSVLIENPKSIEILRNGDENEIYISSETIVELDGLKKDPRLNYIIKEITDELLKYADIIHILKYPMKYSHGDAQILTHVLELAKTIQIPLIFVTNDRLLYFQAKSLGLVPQEFMDSNPYKSTSQYYTGFCKSLEECRDAPNSFIWQNGKLHYFSSGNLKAVDYTNKLWGLTPRTPSQNAAMELLLDPNLDLITLQSSAGFGKTVLALASALYWVFEKKLFSKIYVFKHHIDVGGEKLGYLPGDIEEKTTPYFRPILDLLLKLHDIRPINKIFNDVKNPNTVSPKFFEYLPINFIRGMNIENSVV